MKQSSVSSFGSPNWDEESIDVGSSTIPEISLWTSDSPGMIRLIPSSIFSSSFLQSSVSFVATSFSNTSVTPKTSVVHTRSTPVTALRDLEGICYRPRVTLDVRCERMRRQASLRRKKTLLRSKKTKTAVPASQTKPRSRALSESDR